MGKSLRIRILIIALIFAAITAVAVAVSVSYREGLTLNAFYYGTGTEDDPYRIYSTSQLLNLQEVADSGRAAELTKGKYFKLYGDVECHRSTGYYGRGFYGTLDGNGYTITAGNRGLFCELQSGATIKNVNVKYDITGAYSEVYALCYTIHEGATVENCHAYGDMDIKISKNNSNNELAYCVFSRNNYGVIKDCSYTGNITKTDDNFCGSFYLGIMSLNGDGEVDNCTVNCNLDLTIAGYKSNSITGIAYKCTNSTFNGNITLRDNPKVVRVAKMEIYCLGEYSKNSTLKGDTAHNLTRFPRLVFKLSSYSNEEGQNTFIGTYSALKSK